MNYSLRPETAAAFKDKVVLLTGSAGFLGKHFNVALHDAGAAQILCMDPADTGLDAANHEHWVSRDWSERPTADYVIHAAGIASPSHYHARPLAALDAAIAGTRNALEYCKQHGARLLFLSSSEIYGNPPAAHVPTLESFRGIVACRGPRACYDESKRLAETLCHIYHGQGVESVTVRLFNFYGPGMSPTDYRVLPNWREAIRREETIRIYGNGNQTRTFCYVTDGIRGCLEALAHGVPGDVYNIGAPGPEVSMLELASVLGRVVGKSLDFVRIDHPDTYPADEPQRRCPDIRKAREHFGFEPVVSLGDGLREFMNEAT